jgi:hypothetical protein
MMILKLMIMMVVMLKKMFMNKKIMLVKKRCRRKTWRWKEKMMKIEDYDVDDDVENGGDE